MATRVNRACLRLRLTANELQRREAHARKEERRLRLRIKGMIVKNEAPAMVREQASAVVAQQSLVQSLHRYRMRVHDVERTLQQASAQQTLTRALSVSVDAMQLAQDVIPMDELAHMLSCFEQTSENVEVRMAYLQDGITQATSTMAPAARVDEVLQSVGDEHALEVRFLLATPPQSALARQNIIGAHAPERGSRVVTS